MDKQAFSKLPTGTTLDIKPFTAAVSDQQLSDFKQLLKLSPLGRPTYDNTQTDRRFGATHEWMTAAKSHWETSFDWRAAEAHINSFPNFTTTIQDPHGQDFPIHFLAIFSTNPSAQPLLLIHGWPGSFLEFLDVVTLFTTKYPTPATMPYHLIVPSLPGYGYSTPLPTAHEFNIDDPSPLLNSLMTGLGFTNTAGQPGYIAQGGDYGSYVARELAISFPACIGIHLNMNIQGPPSSFNSENPSRTEKICIDRRAAFGINGAAYQMIHGTKPATMGFCLSASPVSLLAWIGEKMLAWSDEDPPLNKILENVTLYWMTNSFPTSIYPYKVFVSRPPHGRPPEEILNAPYTTKYCKKPMGYSWFPKDIGPVPVEWVAQTGRMVWSKEHTEGGHFAALEKPGLLVEDLEECVAAILQADS